MGVFVVRRWILRLPGPYGKEGPLAEDEQARRGTLSRYFRPLLKVTLGLLIVLLLLGIVWVTPVVSQHLAA
jgi:hypothetical protein